MFLTVKLRPIINSTISAVHLKTQMLTGIMSRYFRLKVHKKCSPCVRCDQSDMYCRQTHDHRAAVDRNL